MIEFNHSDIGSIRCPLHKQRETFIAGSIIQPTNPSLVRYPCGYVDGFAPTVRGEPLALEQSEGFVEGRPAQDELIQELANRVKRLEEQPYARSNVPRMGPRLSSQTTSTKEPSIMENYGKLHQ